MAKKDKYLKDNPETRGWTLTINNFNEHGYPREKVIEILDSMPLRYYALSEELAPSTSTHHMHVYFYSKNPMYFNTVKNKFKTAHIEPARESAHCNRRYLLKTGPWMEEKIMSVIEGTFFEKGEIPTPQQEKQAEWQLLIDEVQEGKTTRDIILQFPKYAFKGKDIEALRQNLIDAKYRNEFRNVEVYYFYGASGSGKTYEVMKRHSTDVCRITNYQGSSVKFDAYVTHDVLVFEEFRSQIHIADMLSYLDIFPLMLPARYADKVACYTKVYIISNIPLDKQYENVQLHEPETWMAFLRRIKEVIEFTPDRKQIKHDVIEFCKYDWQKTKLKWARLDEGEKINE